MTYSARRPYQQLKKGIAEFFKEPVRFLKESNQKESAFEKPYQEEEYQTMHVDLPVPTWPSITPIELPPLPPLPPFPPFPTAPFGGKAGGGIGGGMGIPGRPGQEEGPIYGTGCKYCVAVCSGEIARDPDDCDEAHGWCHIGIACTKDPQIGKPNPGDISWIVKGPVLKVVEDTFEGIDIYVDWDAVESDKGRKTAHFEVTLIDGVGNVCYEDFDVMCPSEDCCDTAEDVSWDDDASAETIAQNSSAVVAVKDGCGPFSWSVSGTGFSLGSGVTTGRTNTLLADGTACGSATITVTDDCGNTASGVVRCTTGEWVERDHLRICYPETDACVSIVCDTNCYPYSGEHISDEFKSTYSGVTAYGYNSNDTDHCDIAGNCWGEYSPYICYCGGTNYTAPAYEPLDSPCDLPFITQECSPHYSYHVFMACCAVEAYVYEWVC